MFPDRLVLPSRLLLALPLLIAPLIAGEPALLEDIAPGSASSSPGMREAVTLAGVTFFAATTPGEGRELWRSDGTAAGTFLVKDLLAGAASGTPRSFCAVGSRIFFSAGKDGAQQLWVSDGTSAGTVLLADFGSSGAVGEMVAYNGRLVFAGGRYSIPFGATHPGVELWASDGTPGGTAQVREIAAGAAASIPHCFVELGGILYFMAATSVTSGSSSSTAWNYLWRTDGTAAGTQQVSARFYYATTYGYPAAGIAVLAGRLYVAGMRTVGSGMSFSIVTGLWTSDGTDAGTALVKDTNANLIGARVLAGKLIFQGGTSATGAEPWRSDGTAAGTAAIADLVGGSTGSAFVPVGGDASRVYGFTTTYTGVGSIFDGTFRLLTAHQLWRTDGTAAGTAKVMDLAADLEAADVLARSDFRPFAGRLVFPAATAAAGQELWQTDGTGTAATLVKDLRPGSGGSFPRLTAAGDRLLIAANDGALGSELWLMQEGNSAPVFAQPPAASPSPVTATTATLTARGSDDGGEGSLTYTWSLASGPAAVAFSVNGGNAAKSCTATFAVSGSYALRCTISDAQGLSASADVAVSVQATAASVALTPAGVRLNPGQTQQYAASVRDQFDQPMAATPAWSAGGGTITGAGLFTAGASAGSFTVTAAVGAARGTVPVTVNAAPVVSVAAAASPNPVIGTSTSLSVAATDDAGPAGLVYTWSALGTPPAPVLFPVNGGNAASACTAIFAKAGAYTLRCTIADAGGRAATSDVAVTVQAVHTAIALAPTTATVANGMPRQFTATALDQFGLPLATQPPITWSMDAGGVGSVSAAGLYTAPAASAGTATVRATAGTRSATAAVTVTNGAPTIAAAAAATLNAAGTAAQLSARGADDGGEGALTYTWSASAAPSGATVSFSVNGSNLAKASAATFSALGAYTLQCTVRDAGGLSVSTSVGVTVGPTVTAVSVAPATATVNRGATQAFTASARDQLGGVMAAAFAWSVDSGGLGSIDAASGVYSAPASGNGLATVRATAAGKSATAVVTVPAEDIASMTYFGVYSGIFTYGYAQPAGGFIRLGKGVIRNPTAANASFDPDRTQPAQTVHFGAYPLGSGTGAVKFSFSLDPAPTPTRIEVGKGWISGSGNTLTLIADRAVASRPGFFAVYALDATANLTRRTYSFLQPGHGLSIALGRGWIEGPDTGYRFVADRAQPAQTLYCSNYPIDATVAKVGFGIATTSAASNVRLGKGWIDGDDGTQSLVPDKRIASEAINAGKYLLGGLGNPTASLYSPEPPSAGLEFALGRGWVEGPEGALRFVADRAQPSAMVYIANYPLSATSARVSYGYALPSGQVGVRVGMGWIDADNGAHTFAADTTKPSPATYFGKHPLGGLGNPSVTAYGVDPIGGYGLSVGRGRISGQAISTAFEPDQAVAAANVYFGTYQLDANTRVDAHSLVTAGSPTLGLGWIRGRLGVTTFIPAANPVSRDAYLGFYAGILSFGQTLPSGAAIALGRGFVDKAGASNATFEPDRTVAARLITFGTRPLGSGSRTTFSVDAASGALDVGHGWIRGAAGGVLTLVADRGRAPRPGNYAVHSLNAVPGTFGLASLQVPAHGRSVALGLGWIEGPDTAHEFVPDQGRAGVDVFYASYETSPTTRRTTFSTAWNGSGIVLNKGWLKAKGGVVRLIAARAVASRDCFRDRFDLGNGVVAECFNHSVAAPGSGFGIALGRGWLEGADTGYDFVPDQGRAAQMIHVANVPLSNSTAKVYFTPEALGPGTRPRLGYGWVRTSAGVPEFVPDASRPSDYCYYAPWSLGGIGSPVPRLCTIDQPLQGLHLGRGRISGTLDLSKPLTFAPDVAAPAEPVYFGTYELGGGPTMRAHSLRFNGGDAGMVGQGWIVFNGTETRLLGGSN